MAISVALRLYPWLYDSILNLMPYLEPSGPTPNPSALIHNSKALLLTLRPYSELYGHSPNPTPYP